MGGGVGIGEKNKQAKTYAILAASQNNGNVLEHLLSVEPTAMILNLIPPVIFDSMSCCPSHERLLMCVKVSFIGHCPDTIAFFITLFTLPFSPALLLSQLMGGHCLHWNGIVVQHVKVFFHKYLKHHLLKAAKCSGLHSNEALYTAWYLKLESKLASFLFKLRAGSFAS